VIRPCFQYLSWSEKLKTHNDTATLPGTRCFSSSSQFRVMLTILVAPRLVGLIDERAAARRDLGILLIKGIPEQGFGLSAAVKAEEIYAVWSKFLGEKEAVCHQAKIPGFSPSGLHLDRTEVAIQPSEHIFENLQ
jgi:hypothetical protein